MPFGNKTIQGHFKDHVAMYLEAPEATFTPTAMAPKAKFTISLVNHIDPRRNISRGTLCMSSGV